MFIKHSPKKLVIAESVTLQNPVYRLRSGKQIPVNKGKTVFILVFKESNAHSLFEKTTEISGLKKSNFCNFLQRN